jgi:hypothetical protein
VALASGAVAAVVLAPRHGELTKRPESASAPPAAPARTDAALDTPAETAPGQGVRVVTAPPPADAPTQAANPTLDVAEPTLTPPPQRRMQAVTAPPPAQAPTQRPMDVAGPTPTAPPRQVQIITAPPPPQTLRRPVLTARAPVARTPQALVGLADARRNSLPDLRPSEAGAVAVRPAFHCDWRLRPSEQMVCADPELAGLDRQLNHAFTLAVRSGVSRAALREQQDDWELARERAARRSPGAVAELYRERIDDLLALAERRSGDVPD